MEARIGWNRRISLPRDLFITTNFPRLHFSQEGRKERRNVKLISYQIYIPSVLHLAERKETIVMRAATFRNETTITRIPTFYPCLPAFHAIKRKGEQFSWTNRSQDLLTSNSRTAIPRWHWYDSVSFGQTTNTRRFLGRRSSHDGSPSDPNTLNVARKRGDKHCFPYLWSIEPTFSDNNSKLHLFHRTKLRKIDDRVEDYEIRTIESDRID